MSVLPAQQCYFFSHQARVSVTIIFNLNKIWSGILPHLLKKICKKIWRNIRDWKLVFLKVKCEVDKSYQAVFDETGTDQPKWMPKKLAFFMQEETEWLDVILYGDSWEHFKKIIVEHYAQAMLLEWERLWCQCSILLFFFHLHILLFSLKATVEGTYILYSKRIYNLAMITDEHWAVSRNAGHGLRRKWIKWQRALIQSNPSTYSQKSNCYSTQHLKVFLNEAYVLDSHKMRSVWTDYN